MGRKRWYVLSLLVLATGFLLGPKVTFEEVSFQKMPDTGYAGSPDKMVRLLDGNEKRIKPGNESKIIWADTIKKNKTGKVILYLHGFSASPEEGYAFVKDISQQMGCNVYLPRLYQHGLKDVNAFEDFTPEKYIQSAKDAFDFCRLLGDSVIVFSCSTGSTLGIILAARGENIAAHYMYSPNIKIVDRSAALLLWPWGRQLGELVLGGEYHEVQYAESQAKYWYDKYHMNGIIALEALLETYMTETCFQKIMHPVFLAYYYRDEDQQDPVVSVEAMLKMYDQLGTPVTEKRKMAFAGADTHMIISPLFSKQIPEIKAATLSFAKEVMHWIPAE